MRSTPLSIWFRLPTLCALILLGVPSVARAQIGTGWTQFFPGKNVQLRGAGAKYDNSNGIETFSIAPGDERSEARIFDDHRSGRWQFEGWVSVKPGINGGSIHQVFKFLMIVAYSNDGGELRQHSYQKLNATGVFGKWVRVNTVHDADAGSAEVYIDGTLRGTVASKSPGPNGWYHKYGIYNSSGSSPEVKWKDVKFFHGPGTVPPAPTDASPPSADARFDVVPLGDAVRADAVQDSSEAGGSGAGGNVGAGGGAGSGQGVATGGTTGAGGGGAGNSGAAGNAGVGAGSGGSAAGAGGQGPRSGGSGTKGSGGAGARNDPGPRMSSASGCAYGQGDAGSQASVTQAVGLALALAALARHARRRGASARPGRVRSH